MESSPRKIIHIDMDAFYASIEQRDDPSLRGRPVAVGYPEKRGVVAAAMPSTTALRKCPHLVFVPHRFDADRSVSRQIHEIFANYTDLVEPLSLDEAYLDVTSNKAGLPTATETARLIRARIHEATGLTASAGISYNKFLTKMASDQNKPNGQFLGAPGSGEAFAKTLPIGRFYGVGEKTEARMRALDIHTGEDLHLQGLEHLIHHFGNSGPWFYGVARGIDHRPVNPDRERKSSGSETTFSQDLVDEAAIEAGVIAMAGDVWAWCLATHTFARTVTVKIKYGDFQQATRSRASPGPILDQESLRRVSVELVRSVFPPSKGIRLVGVTVSKFDPSATPIHQWGLGFDERGQDDRLPV